MAMPSGRQTIQRLVEEHYPSLYRYAYRLSGSDSDAWDLTQETFCKAQQNLGQLREESRVRSWLYSILRNAYLQRRRTGLQEACVSLDDVGDLAEPVAEDLPEIDTEQLQEALNELPEVYRTPIILYYFEEFGYRDIAEQMDLPIGTVMSRLARAKSHLRKRLFPGSGESREPVSTNGHQRRANDGL
jgi:RNA polymerase sigma-70 factor (ECF subfamily)